MCCMSASNKNHDENKSRRDGERSSLKCWAGAGAGHFRLRG
jgi:hypothetical protein